MIYGRAETLNSIFVYVIHCQSSLLNVFFPLKFLPVKIFIRQNFPAKIFTRQDFPAKIFTRQDLESSDFKKLFDACLTILKNNQILVHKICR